MQTVQPNYEPVIELKELTKLYGNHCAVNRLNLSISKGEIFGLLGPNGAGKTTTILMMLGLTEPSKGTARVCGLDPVRAPLQVKRRVGYLPDDVGFYEDRTALDNLVYTARLNRIASADAKERALALLDKVGLQDAATKLVGTFSRGMRQRLGLADVLIKQPEIIILDEPTLGIDPEGVRELLALISSLSREEGLTVLLSSHHLHQVQQVCDRVGLFVSGTLIACGDIETLSRTLDDQGTVTVEFEVAEWPPALTEMLTSLEGVQSLNLLEEQDRLAISGGMKTTRAQVICGCDLTPDLARLIVQSGAPLLAISRKVYGLDDIYHRYFEGGDHLAAAANPMEHQVSLR
ncbi:ABC transporter ATP-binding protein [Paenibacillus senegalensis]|uniref:ABC transporter ATP-binding protein n=1 Tax=Paenibacillus senegalensis TaxID=1465766 RepID=UPI000289B465|nr:ABC transporter ATP-binding protein [Paenibacillus senegalensis]